MNDLLDALGYVGSSLDKPGRAVRGLLGGRPDELAALVPFSDSLGLTDPSRAVSGEDLVRQAGVNTGSSWGNALLGFGAETALDPTTYLGGFAARAGMKALGRGATVAARAAPEAAEGASLLAKAGSQAVPALAPGVGSMPTAALKNLRSKFGFVGATHDDLKLAGRDFFGAMPPGDAINSAHELATVVEDAQLRGAYSPDMNMAVVTDPGKPGGWAARRHEIMHGLIENARRAGDSSGVPSTIGKIATNLPDWSNQGSHPILRGLGLVADETAAHAAEGRTLGDQMASVKRFFTKPEAVDWYGGQLQSISPMVAALYRNAQYAPRAAAFGGAGIGAGAVGALAFGN
jgi:hypothetical protein